MYSIYQLHGSWLLLTSAAEEPYSKRRTSLHCLDKAMSHDAIFHAILKDINKSHKYFANFTSLKSRKLQVARKIALCDSNYSESIL